MSDQCTNCIVRGDIDKCTLTACNHHESWIDIVRINRIKTLEDALKPFADSAKEMAWESTPDHLEFWPVNSVAFGGKPLTAGDMRRAMETFSKCLNR